MAGSGSVTGERNGWGREMIGGSHLSARWREGAVPIREEGFLGHGSVSCLGRFGSPGSVSVFIFLSSFSFF
jgi:hypothetical protein